ncbi:hypothetical protein QQS21_007574 [Conoideocrella luteorostrata]|uniref:Aminoglycoside phosphotransferase domain-containing protein n=1 Tax=Conoideocrella luteorostrata TaxID=1105319 RepID=A0AAJ0CN77_9HYPO|nr:hypothetical protein QQS21_007574 [Conoideocrella luteorostrata]
MAENTDYQIYLNSIYPNTTWSISRLSGGVVNFTFRATLVSGSAPYESLIIKHARPYIAAGGPEWAFTTQRQTVEAELLSLWDADGALFPQRNRTTKWRSPHLIRHDQGKESELGLSSSDEEASVLVLADLGSLVNIVEFLTFHATNKENSITNDERDEIAAVVGHAFGIIHSPSTKSIIHATPTCAAKLTHSYTEGVLYQTGIEPIKSRLGSHPDAALLYDRVLGEFKAPKYKYPKCLAMGDFTPGSILMDAPSSTASHSPIIVDWEFARVNGHGINGDIACFLASMRCELLLAQQAGSTSVYEALLGFTAAFCAAYRQTSELICRKQGSDVNMQLLRATFLVHGREMINRAYDTYESSSCVKEMVELGTWYIERAGDSVEDFYDAANWEKLQEERDLLIQSLFIFP